VGFKGTELDVVNFYEKASRRFPPGLPKLGLSHIFFLSLIVDWKRGVDGERFIEIVKPIPTTSQGKNFELRRETIGAYDKGKAGLVLEEQTVLVDASTGEIYTKMIGSSFFVGQVLLPFFATNIRADMVVLKARRSQVINHHRANNQIKLPSSELVLVKPFYIG
jgi:hypothetical protein